MSKLSIKCGWIGLINFSVNLFNIKAIYMVVWNVLTIILLGGILKPNSFIWMFYIKNKYSIIWTTLHKFTNITLFFLQKWPDIWDNNKLFLVPLL